MKQQQSKWSVVLRWLVALLAGVLLGSVVQSQLNLHLLSQAGASIDFSTRLSTTFHDLLNFSPTLLVLSLPGFAVSQWVAVVLAKRMGLQYQTPLCTLGGFLGLWLAIKVLDMVAPTPGLIYSTISSTTAVLFYATAAVAGALFSRLKQAGTKSKPKHLGVGQLAMVSSLLLIGGLGASEQANAQPSYQIQTVVEGLDKPWSMAFLPDGAVLVTEKPGRLRMVKDGKLSEPIKGVPEVLYAGQGGLFEVLLAPNFESSSMIYLSYACGTRAANGTCVSRGRLQNGQLLDLNQIFKTDFSKMGGAHFGGRMVWLPDNTLVLTLGDGYTYRNEAQNISNQYGSLVRINADGSIPKDNPFVGQTGANPAIYSYGHRSVQGLYFDKDSGVLFEHEHGARGGDEINLIEPGKNYGWPLATHGVDYSGAQITPFKEYEGTEQPLVYWVPSIAPSGMTMYTGDLFPKWKGNLLVGALAGRHVRLVKLEDGKPAGQEQLFAELRERIRDVRTGPDGAIYLLTDSSDGALLKVTPQ